jgi:hypothetical protein
MNNPINDTVCIYFTEEELSELLRILPNQHYLRNRLQQAGENIFRW